MDLEQYQRLFNAQAAAYTRSCINPSKRAAYIKASRKERDAWDSLDPATKTRAAAWLRNR